jgi:small subunit ribosomal protein S20
MPHSVSAKKRVRQNVRRRDRNRATISRLRTARRAFLKALETRDLPAAKQRLKACARLLHRAGNRGPLHRNTAARLLGRLQRRLTAVEKAGAGTPSAAQS